MLVACRLAYPRWSNYAGLVALTQSGAMTRRAFQIRNRRQRV
jgi:hypothetical protein